jgi:phosphatidylinositol 3-kinase
MLQLVQAYRYEDFNEGLLKNFFLSKVTLNQSIAQTFFWQVKLEKDNEENHEEIKEMFKDLFEAFMEKLEEDNPECKKLLDDQWKFREKLYALSNYVKLADKVEAKKQRLREAVSEGGKFDMMNFEPTPMPLDPTVFVCGIVPEKCSVFTSALCPLKLTFRVTEETQKLGNPRVDGEFYNIMYKQGDDVRQDQLVLQILDVIDFVLQQINLDFKLSAYKVVAHSEKDGMLEFVPNCSTIQSILQQYRPKNNVETHIGLFLQNSCYKHGLNYNEVFDTYIYSCAGYAVITYLLAIGDRHLENLLIDESGHFFHVDFGFIFGKNPPFKGIQPPIRICKQMIQCMGGFESDNYKRFVDK